MLADPYQNIWAGMIYEQLGRAEKMWGRLLVQVQYESCSEGSSQEWRDI